MGNQNWRSILHQLFILNYLINTLETAFRTFQRQFVYLSSVPTEFALFHYINDFIKYA